jgi:hypothetical protein
MEGRLYPALLNSFERAPAKLFVQTNTKEKRPKPLDSSLRPIFSGEGYVRRNLRNRGMLPLCQGIFRFVRQADFIQSSAQNCTFFL